MKPDPHSSDVLLPQDVADLPPKRKWFGYAVVAASLAITYALWLAALGAADEWYDNPWIYPAKVGKIAYHRWKRSHDFFGALLVLIVLHAVLANGEIMRYPVLWVWQGTWVILALAAFAYIRVFYRRFGPLYDYTVESVNDVGDAITEIMLKPKRRSLRPAPGQFIYVSFDADAVNKEPHPFSISSPPEAAHLRISIKQLGDWTQDVAQIKPGKSGRVWGPYGHFTKLALAQPLMPLVMIGGGIGITPFLSLVGSGAFARRGGKSTLVYAIPDRSSAVYLEELRTREDALPHFALSAHYSDEAGFVDRAYLESVVKPPLLDCLFLVCGPPPLMAAMRTLLAVAGVSARQVIMEDFEIR